MVGWCLLAAGGGRDSQNTHIISSSSFSSDGVCKLYTLQCILCNYLLYLERETHAHLYNMCCSAADCMLHVSQNRSISCRTKCAICTVKTASEASRLHVRTPAEMNLENDEPPEELQCCGIGHVHALGFLCAHQRLKVI